MTNVRTPEIPDDPEGQEGPEGPISRTSPNTSVTPAVSDISPPVLSPAQILGEAVFLFMSSPSHRHLFLADLEWRVTPAILRRQFKMFRLKRQPVAFASWAMVSDGVIERLKRQEEFRLGHGDWQSGDTALLVDIVAPHGGVADFAALCARDLAAREKTLHRLVGGPAGGCELAVVAADHTGGGTT